MKFIITLTVEHTKYGNRLPVNYQYELSAFIYHTLAHANSEYSAWLHENGFATDTKRFKLFTFSNLILPSFKITDDRIEILSQKAGLIVSFLPERSTEEFIKGLFSNQSFSIGDRQSKVQFSVTGIELLPLPDFNNTITYSSLSPVCITRRETGTDRIIYEMPDSPYASDALLMNLKNKYRAFHEKDTDSEIVFEYEPVSKIRSKLIAIKTNTAQQTKVKGYLFDFKLKTTPELAQIMYSSGFGEKNALGFGCVEVKENMKSIREKLK